MIDHEQICCSLTSVSLVKLAVFIASSSMSNQFSFFYSEGWPWGTYTLERSSWNYFGFMHKLAWHWWFEALNDSWKSNLLLNLLKRTFWSFVSFGQYGLKSSMFQVAEFKRFIEDMAAASLRCIAFAYRTYEMDGVPNEDQRDEWKLPDDNLIMLGIVGIKVHNEFWSVGDCCRC